MIKKLSFAREQQIRADKSADKALAKGADATVQHKKWHADRGKRVERAKTFSVGMKVVTDFGDEGVVVRLGENGDVKVKVGNKTRSFNADILKPAADASPAE